MRGENPVERLANGLELGVGEGALRECRGVARGVKLAGYFSLPSVRHYLIVDTDKRTVIHHRRDEQGAISVRILHGGPIALDPPGLEIETGDIFSSL